MSTQFPLFTGVNKLETKMLCDTNIKIWGFSNHSSEKNRRIRTGCVLTEACSVIYICMYWVGKNRLVITPTTAWNKVELVVNHHLNLPQVRKEIWRKTKDILFSSQSISWIVHVILLCILTLLKAFCARRLNLKKLFSFFFDRIINKLISTYQPRVCNLYMGKAQIETLHS